MPNLLHDVGMTTEWDRLAGAIRERRQALGMTQQQLAEAAGVTRTTIKNMEGARQPTTRLPSSITATEHALGWTPGSARAILAGGEPGLDASGQNGAAVRYEVEAGSDMPEDVGMIVRNTVIEVVGVLAPNTPLSEVREIEERALAAVLRRGGRPRQRHPQAYQDAGGTETISE